MSGDVKGDHIGDANEMVSTITATVYCPHCRKPNVITPRQGFEEKCEYCGKDYVTEVRAETVEKYIGVEWMDAE